MNAVWILLLIVDPGWKSQDSITVDNLPSLQECRRVDTIIRDQHNKYAGKYGANIKSVCISTLPAK